ncbi:MAG: hypothetical protein ACE15E_21885 [Acidobacteriota bacterium]
MKVIQTAVLGVLLTVGAWSQSGQKATGSQGQKAGRPTGMTTSCQDMAKQRQKMMSDMQQMDQELQAKISAMNSATGDQKIRAIADAVNELARQRHDMFARMQEMDSATMSHMGEHMQSGGGQAMANCPMMKQMSQQAREGTATKPATGKKAE